MVKIIRVLVPIGTQIWPPLCADFTALYTTGSQFHAKRCITRGKPSAWEQLALEVNILILANNNLAKIAPIAWKQLLSIITPNWCMIYFKCSVSEDQLKCTQPLVATGVNLERLGSGMKLSCLHVYSGGLSIKVPYQMWFSFFNYYRATPS